MTALTYSLQDLQTHLQPRLTQDTSQRGKASERRALECALTLGFRARLATPEEDHRGLDLLVFLPEGDLPIQVKSSQKAAHKFEKRKLGIPVLVVGDCSDHEVRAQLTQLAYRHSCR